LLEDDLNKKFKHNVQSVIIFHELEKKYCYKGLALTIPVLEGILKHTKYQDELPDFFERLFIEEKNSITVEGQIVAVADEIAQMTHDMDDYFRINVFSLNDFMDDEIFEYIDEFCDRFYGSSLETFFDRDSTRKELIAIRCLVDFLVTTVIEESEKKLDDGIKAYELKDKYIDFGDRTDMILSFQKKIQNKCINNPKVKEMDKRGKNIIETLYKFYKDNPGKLPSDTFEQYKNIGITALANHISGMTDRYAIKCYEDMINM
jgi:dGTPase